MSEKRDNGRRTGPALEKAYQFVLWLIPTVEKFPRGQRFLLGDRIQTAVLEVTEGIVEATYSPQSEPILRRVNLALEKLRLLFWLAKDLRYVDLRRYVTRHVRAWVAHAEHADTWRLRQAIFRGGGLTPPGRPDRPR